VQKTIREIKTAIAFPKWSLWVKNEKGKKKKAKNAFTRHCSCSMQKTTRKNS